MYGVKFVYKLRFSSLDLKSIQNDVTSLINISLMLLIENENSNFLLNT